MKKTWCVLFMCVIYLSSAAACDWLFADGGENEICTDGIDNDGDGDIDCWDSDCGFEGPTEISCNDGRDNDCDGQVDFMDMDCETAPYEICGDGLDNDGDGDVDCDDSDCAYACGSGESWTFMLYMVGDNNLEPDAISDLNEMMAAGSGPNFNIVAQLDRAFSYTNEGVGGLPDWETAKRLEVGQGFLEDVADLGEVNMGDPAVLSDFIAWAVTSYSADRYALIFWDHGGAWPGFGGDESTLDHDVLTLGELQSGIRSGLEAAGIDRFSLLGFDACLMGTYEVVLAMSEFSDYVLASQELEPGHGWDYGSLSTIRGNPSLGPVDMGDAIMQGFQAQATAQRQEQAITLALTDAHKLPSLVEALSAFSSTLQGDISYFSVVAGQQRTQVEEYGKAPDPKDSTNMVDLVDFADLMAVQEPSLAGAADAVKNALADAVVLKINGPLRPNAHGLSIYFPPQRIYYDPNYDSVTSAQAWRPYLQAQLDYLQTDLMGPVFTNPDKIATVETYETYAIVSGQLDPSTATDLADIYFTVGINDAGNNLIYYGNYPAAFDPGTSLVSYQWDYTTAKITQGGLTDNAFVDIYPTPSGQIEIQIPLALFWEGVADPSFIYWFMVYDPASGQTLQSTFYLVDEQGTWSEVGPRPGCTFIPLVYVLPPAGDPYWNYVATTFDPLQPFELVFEEIPYGETIMVGVTAVDTAGNSDSVYFIGVI